MFFFGENVNINSVIMEVAPLMSGTKGRDRVAHLSSVARKALGYSAKLSGVKFLSLQKAANGAPLPFNGVYWSISHTKLMAAAVLSRRPIGIDVEKVRPRPESLITKVVSGEELALKGEQNVLVYFFRVWTAKEAVLKAEGVGLSGLGRCTTLAVYGDKLMKLTFENKVYHVEQAYLKGHIVSVVSNGEKINWALVPMSF